MPRLPPEIRAIIRRRRWGRWLYLTAMGVLCLTVVSEHAGCFGWRGSDQTRFDQKTFLVEAISRSGTLWIADDNGRVEVRLLGLAEASIDTQACAAYLARSVVVKLEPLQTRDTHGRLLAYLYLDAQTVVNVELARAGAARADRDYPNTLRAVIEGAESDARRRKRGMWRK